MPRVLLVDDDPDVLESLADWLRREHEVRVAHDVPQALAALAEGPPPDVVITDYDMPPHSGEDLLSVVAALYPDACRLLYTGRRGVKSTAHQILTKGSSPQKLSAAIRRCRR
jgi:DNA-binding NtrC family response regulator